MKHFIFLTASQILEQDTEDNRTFLTASKAHPQLRTKKLPTKEEAEGVLAYLEACINEIPGRFPDLF